jgi:two-component sensor histidine kinase/CheY-like chemotaxis protein
MTVPRSIVRNDSGIANGCDDFSGQAMSIDFAALAKRRDEQAALFEFTDKLYRAIHPQDVYEAALTAITCALGCARASILLADDTGVMRFVAARGLSDAYRKAVEGHSPWKVGDRDAEAIFVTDIDQTNEPESLKTVVKGEGIRALAFIPLLVRGAVVGKFMAYHAEAHEFTPDEIRVALTIARQLGFSIERQQAEEARKEAERLQQLLISELNHRVKNTLATVGAIATQTVRAANSPGEFASSFMARLQSLGQTHTLLTDNNWQGAEVLTLVRDQLLLGGLEDDRISYVGPLVRLNPQTSLHLALVLHELGTNARKYGALSVPRGELTLRWALRSDDKLEFEWKERNGPPVVQPSKKGFGSKLIEQSVTSRGGAAAIRYEPDGLVCEIIFAIGEPGRPSATPRSREPQRLATGSTRRMSEGTKVLVVEDEPLVALDITSILTEAGYQVIGPAADLIEAISLIEKADFDVALLDANLDGQGVEELALALGRADVPFAFLTGYSRDGLPAEFEQTPMMQKPFLPDQLLTLVGSLGRNGLVLDPSRDRPDGPI